MNFAVGVSSCTSCPSGMWSAGESTNSSSCVADTNDHCSVGSREFSQDGVSTYANGPVCVAQNIYPADEVAHCVFEHTWHDVIWDLFFTCSGTREVFVPWHYDSVLRLFT